jgi:hypothetical protein
MTAQNTDLSSSDTLYVYYTYNIYMHIYTIRVYIYIYMYVLSRVGSVRDL